jgi:hypothetical protein
MTRIWIPSLWRVRLKHHNVARWLIPARNCKVPAVDAEDACRIVVRWAHSDADVPPWKPSASASSCCSRSFGLQWSRCR